MATTIRELLVAIGVDAGDADKKVGDLDDALGDLKSVMLQVVAVGAAVTAAIAGITVASAGAADAVAKGASRTATGAEAYQELAFAFKQAGIESQVMEQALIKQAEAVGQLIDGTGPAADAYTKLGLSAAEMAALSPDEQLRVTAEALANVTDEQERLRLAQDIYGAELASRMMPLLEGGAENLDEMARMAHELGIVLSEEQTEAAVEFNDTLDQMWQVLLAIRNTIGLALLPTFTAMLQSMRDWWIANRDVINQKLEVWLAVFVSALLALGDAAEFIGLLFTSVFGGEVETVLLAVAAAVAAVVAAVVAFAALKVWTAIVGVITAIGAIGFATFGQVIAIVVALGAAIVGLFLILQDLWVMFQGGDSAIGRFIEQFREADGLLGAMARALEAFFPLVQQLIDLQMTWGAIILDVLERTALPLLHLVMAVLSEIGEYMGGRMTQALEGLVVLFDLIGAAFAFAQAQLDAMRPTIDWLLARLEYALQAISAITGVDVTVAVPGGGGPALGTAAGGPGASTGQLQTGGTLDASSLFAPTPGVGTGQLQTGGTLPGNQVTVQGSTYNISGLGLSKEEVIDAIVQAETERNREVNAVLQGLER